MAAASIKSREATEAPQTAGGARASPTGRSHQQTLSLTRKCLKTHSETSLASDHPVRAFSERVHFFGGAATPPLQGGEYARLKSFTASMTDATQTGLVSIFLFQVSLEIDPERSFFKNSSPETKDFRRPKSPKAGFPDRSLALG